MKKEQAVYASQQGLYAGLIQGILYFLMYFFNRPSLASFTFGFVLILFVFTYPVVVTVRYRKNHGNVLIFKDTFFMLFLISFIRGVLSGAIFLLLFHVIDPGLSDYIKEKTIENTMKMLQSFGSSEEAINEAIERLQNSPDQFSVNQQLKGTLWSIPIIAVFSLIGAAIIKKNPPVFKDSLN